MNSARHRGLAITAALLAVASPASAVTLFFDHGDPQDGVLGGPLDHTNPVVLAEAGQTFTLHLWAIPENDDASVLASLGYDVLISGSASADVTAVAHVLDNPQMGVERRWTGVDLHGGLNTDGKLVADQRATHVPASLPFEGGIGSLNLPTDPGLDPNGSGAVYVGRLDLQIDAGVAQGSSAEIRLAVSPLLIARITTESPSAEPLNFGFDAGGPDPATGTGSVLGASSGVADATIAIFDGPPGVPSQMEVGKQDQTGTALSMYWDTSLCSGALDHQILFGGGSQLPAAPGGIYSLGGSECQIGTTSPFLWSPPDPSTDPTGWIWWVIVATDGSQTEGSWGTDGDGAERSGPAAGGASGACGVTDKSLSNTCGQ